ncbi:hypothetical protein Cgig2_003944 [Carnegiea gigantea]|uniref:Metallothionein n=1 Tax=Carnegiea gigantea TaxID=171969 RepID=A0A9Q1KBK3_9CARY|nr:hypothetical protein Cgig2_003944 [Carnegiea gigantea]
MVQVLTGVVVYLLRGQSSQTCKAEIFNSASNMPIYRCQPSSLFNQDLLNCNLYITRSLSPENSLSILFKRKWQEAANVVTTAPVAADATATGCKDACFMLLFQAFQKKLSSIIKCRKKMSGACKCGDNCTCGSGCNCNRMYVKNTEGCGCGDDCNCDPCTC